MSRSGHRVQTKVQRKTRGHQTPTQPSQPHYMGKGARSAARVQRGPVNTGDHRVRREPHLPSAANGVSEMMRAATANHSDDVALTHGRAGIRR
jgi:hypothetical protein